MAKILFRLLALLCSFMISASGATTLFGTLGYGGGSYMWQGYCPTESTCYNTSYLVKIDAATGEILESIGEVGYYVIGLAYDPSSGKLYGSSSSNDPTFTGLIEINTTTGAGTPAGADYWGFPSTSAPVTTIAINSAGQMYGWKEGTRDLVSIDKATGIATLFPESGASQAGTYGLAFNSIDDLYLVDWGGDTYIVNTTTGIATLQFYVTEDDSHHGSIDWATDLYYALSWDLDGYPRSLYRCDFLTHACTTVGSAGIVHTLAFQNTLGSTKYALSVAKSGAGTGTVRSAPAGIDCGTDCGQDYFSGRIVTLYATANSDSVFAGWTGDDDCSDGVVTMDSARSCTATFNLKPSYTLQVSKSGTGTGTVTSTPTGINCGEDCSENYVAGTTVTLSPVADADSAFAGWTGDEDCSNGVLAMEGARSCVATFNLKPVLLVNKAGSGTGTVTSTPSGINCGSDCSEAFINGTSVSLSAVADASSVFAGWSGDSDCSDGAVTMGSDRTCTATFNLKPVLLVSKAGTGTGTVTSSPAGISCGSDCSESYASGTSVTLSAVADAGSVFAGWSGDADCSDGAVTMNSDRNCTATFDAAILVTSPNGGETWQAGSQQTITWTYSGSGGTYVTVELLKGGVLERRIASRVSIGTGGTGSISWKPPQVKTSASDYSIRITSKSNDSYTDTSDAYFTIAPRR